MRLGLGLRLCGQSSAAAVSSFTPASLTGLKLWTENDATKVYTDLGTTLATNGQNVQQWNDKSGNARHLNDQGNGSTLFPTWNTTGNGYLSWDGNDTLLTTTQTWVDGSGQCYAAFAGSIADVTSTFALAIDGSVHLLSLSVASGVPTATSFDNVGGNTTATGPAITNNQNVRIIVTVTTTQLTVTVNGVAGTPSSLTGTRNTGNTEFYFASNTGTGRLPSGSKAVGCVVGSGTLSAGDLSSLDTYLAGRF